MVNGVCKGSIIEIWMGSRNNPVEYVKPGDWVYLGVAVLNTGIKVGRFNIQCYSENNLLGEIGWNEVHPNSEWVRAFKPGIMPNNDWKLTFKLICKTETGEIILDVENYVVKIDVPDTAKGKIIACNINKLPCPGDCGEAKEGEEIEVIMGMKNVGEIEGEFRFYIYDQDGNELSKEPDFTYKNVKPGDTWGVSKTLLTNLNFDMINKTLNGKVKLRRQT